MKNTMKALTAGIAAVIASTAMISTASAATYVDYNGYTYSDGVSDGIVTYVDYDGSIYTYQDSAYCYSINDFYDYYSQYYTYIDPYHYNYDYIFNTTSYIGEDAIYGSIYYDPYIGYFAYNGGDNCITFGFNFAISSYVGIDRTGRKVYYNKDIGYFVLSGNGCISYGFNRNNVQW